jgi:hypothetical protein
MGFVRLSLGYYCVNSYYCVNRTTPIHSHFIHYYCGAKSIELLGSGRT